jgi:hypothetical protein
MISIIIKIEDRLSLKLPLRFLNNNNFILKNINEYLCYLLYEKIKSLPYYIHDVNVSSAIRNMPNFMSFEY